MERGQGEVGYWEGIHPCEGGKALAQVLLIGLLKHCTKVSKYSVPRVCGDNQAAIHCKHHLYWECIRNTSTEALPALIWDLMQDFWARAGLRHRLYLLPFSLHLQMIIFFALNGMPDCRAE